MAEPANVMQFRRIVNDMADLYAKKNHDYGDSFGRSIEKYGAIAGLTRISDKFNRLENLMLGANCQVEDEKMNDSLIDLAAYSVMLYMALSNKDNN